MKTRDIIRRAGRNLRQAKVRTLLTSVAIAVGAFTIMLSLAAGEGERQYADKLISSNVDPKSIFIVKDKAIIGGAQPQTGLREYNPDASTQDGVTMVLLNKDDVAALRNRKDITDVRPIYDVNVSYLTIEGSDKKYTSEINTYRPEVLSEGVAGKLPALGTDIKADEVVVPKTFAETLKIPEKELIGKQVTFTIERPTKLPSDEELQQLFANGGANAGKELGATETKQISLKIVAVVKPSQFSFNVSTAALIPINVADTIAEFVTKDTKNYQKYFAVTAKATDSTTPAAVKASLEKEGFYPQTATDLQGFLFTIVNVITGVVAGFGVIALIASIFGIVNTQYISVLERTSQIGLMKALGARRRDIARLFRYEAAWIGFLGGVIGVALAWLIGVIANPFITKMLDLGKGTELLVFTPLSAVALVIGLMIVAIVAGFFPSRKAAKLDPIEALRTE